MRITIIPSEGAQAPFAINAPVRRVSMFGAEEFRAALSSRQARRIARITGDAPFTIDLGEDDLFTHAGSLYGEELAWSPCR